MPQGPESKSNYRQIANRLRQEAEEEARNPKKPRFNTFRAWWQTQAPLMTVRQATAGDLLPGIERLARIQEGNQS